MSTRSASVVWPESAVWRPAEEASRSGGLPSSGCPQSNASVVAPRSEGVPLTLPAGVRVGLLGATSFVGRRVAAQLAAMGAEVVAFDRRRAATELLPLARGDRPAPCPQPDPKLNLPAGLQPHPLPEPKPAPASLGQPLIQSPIPLWVSAAPLWVVPPLLPALGRLGAAGLVALSSTSVLAKAASDDPSEQRVAQALAAAEEAVQAWGETERVTWTLLRPTLIYGGGEDQNVTVIARVLARWGVWPLVGGGRGLRQPIHVDDVAAAVVAAVAAAVSPELANQVLTLTGGETLPYRAMVERIGAAIGRTPHFLPLPAAPLRALSRCWPWWARAVPSLRRFSVGMLTRMAVDQVFDGSAARASFPHWCPRPFVLTPADLPSGW